MTIHVKADITIPDSQIIPVQKVQRYELTQEKLNELIDYFAPDATFTQHDVFTKDFYEEQLINARRGQKIDGEYVINENSEAYVSQVSQLEELWENAPEANEVVSATTEFGHYCDYDGNIDESRGKNFLDVNFVMPDGKNGTIYATRYERGKTLDNCFAYSTEINYSTQSNMKMNYEKNEDYPQEYKDLLDSGYFENFPIEQEVALMQSGQVLSDLGIDYMTVESIEKVMIERYAGMAGFSNVTGHEPGYEIVYSRSLGPVAGYMKYSFSSDNKEDSGTIVYAPPFSMESISMVVSEKGLEAFSWNEMAQTMETISDNPELLSFDEVKDRIIDQVKYTYVPYSNEDITIDILNVNLRPDISTPRMIWTAFGIYPFGWRKGQSLTVVQTLKTKGLHKKLSRLS